MKVRSTSAFFDKPLLYWLPIVLGCLLYAGTYEHGFVLDDNLVITRNVHVQEGVSSIPTLLTTNYAHGHQGLAFNDGLYRPLSLVSFAIEQSIHNLNPGVSHLLQALLYGLLLVALRAWLEALFGRKDWVWWALLLFALHPVHVEVVANLKSRDELFALLFFALSARQFVLWVDMQEWKHLLFSAGLFLLALFSKESAITFLAVYPMMLWHLNKNASKRSWMLTASLLLPAAFFLGVRSLVLTQMGEVDSGVTGMLQNVLTTSDSIAERIATAASIQWLYFEKLSFPFQLSSDYSFNAIPLAQLTDLPALLGLIVTVVLLVLAVKLVRERSAIGFGISFYFVTISVVANLLILIGAMAAERFLFTPSLGWCIALTAFLSEWKASTKARTFALGGFTLLFLVISFNRIPDWKDEYTLFAEDVKYVDESARAHYNAGSAANDRAKTHPQQAVALRSDAVKHLRRAISIWPDYQDAYNNLGVVHLDAGDLSAAYSSFKLLTEKFPGYTKGLYNFGYTCYRMQRYGEAEMAMERYFDMKPNNDVLYLIAECEGYQNKFDEARAHLQQLLEREPNQGRGYLKLGMAHAITGNLQAAEEVLIRGCNVAPQEPELFFNLSLLYFNSKRYGAAISPLQQALAVNPQHQRAQQLLQQARAMSAQTMSQ